MGLALLDSMPESFLQIENLASEFLTQLQHFNTQFTMTFHHPATNLYPLPSRKQ